MHACRDPRILGWILLCGGALAPTLALATDTWKVDSQLRTVAEQSDYRSTASSAFVVEFLDAVSRQAEHIRRFQFGTTVQGRAMMAASVASPALPPDHPLPDDERLVVLIIANIHSGECCGKEAMLRMLRELSQDSNHDWLDQIVLVVVPNYNADGNDVVAKDNRAGQVGPVNGMGIRPNAQQLDLNREYVKLESPEARSLVGLMNRFEPHCFIDLHTTNGSWHRYQLTYDVVHNPAADPLLGDFMRREMMPRVTENLRAKGLETFYYGNFNDDNTRWSTYDHKPRFGLDYVSLRGRLSILSEAYAYITFRDRVEATHSFVSECLDYLASQSSSVKETLAQVEQNTITRGARPTPNDSVAIRARPAPFERKVAVKGFDPPTRPRVRLAEMVDGAAPKPPGIPRDYIVDFYGRYEPSLRVARPFAYAIPASMRRVIQQLEFHGIELKRLSQAIELEVETYRCERVERARVAFQNHHTVLVDTSTATKRQILPEGTVIVPTGQRLGNLAIYMLELGSDDGFVTWNFYDDVIVQGQEFPIVRLMRETALPVRTE